MAASTAFILKQSSQEAFLKYYQQAQALQGTSRQSRRSRYETIDKAYQREEDETKEQQRAKAANRAGDPSRFQNVTIPIVATHVETSVTYQTSVFLTGTPLFGAVAAPEFIDEALQLESIIDEQAIRGGWTAHLIKFFRDCAKYNFGPLEVTWKQEVTSVLETDLTFSATEAKPKEVIWSGNALKRLDPYNVFVDSRVEPHMVHIEGEFVGYTEFVSRIKLKQFIAALPNTITMNATKAFESGTTGGAGTDSSDMGYYVPSINPEISINDTLSAGTNWLAWAGLSVLRKDIQYKDNYELTTLYCRILPSEFDLAIPNRNVVQIWKLIFVNHSVIIYAERQTNAHNLLPILIGQPHSDGLGYQTKSLAANAHPFQSLSTSFMSSIIASRRRAISDRVLYDPSRISSAHINSPNPSAKIPVRPSAFGGDIQKAVYTFPYKEDQAQFSMSQIGELIAIANNLNGQNPARQGQFVKGNKTLHEFDSVMNNANGRDQTESIIYEAQIFTPVKEILKVNILQFQGGVTIYNREKERAIEIDPIKLRKAVLNFKLSDGLVPADKLINAETLSVVLQQLGTSPEIAAGFNVAPLFSYFIKTQGGRIKEFEKTPEQMAYEQALAAWQNIVTIIVEKSETGDPKNLPPRPLPEEFNYNPQEQTPAPKDTGSDQTEVPTLSEVVSAP